MRYLTHWLLLSIIALLSHRQYFNTACFFPVTEFNLSHSKGLRFYMAWQGKRASGGIVGALRSITSIHLSVFASILLSIYLSIYSSWQIKGWHIHTKATVTFKSVFHLRFKIPKIAQHVWKCVYSLRVSHKIMQKALNSSLAYSFFKIFEQWIIKYP